MLPARLCIAAVPLKRRAACSRLPTLLCCWVPLCCLTTLCTRCAGRPFEARNKPKGSAFSGEDKDFFRFKLGDSSVIPAFNEAVAGMKVGLHGAGWDHRV